MKEKILFCCVFLVSYVFAQSDMEDELKRVEENLDSLGEYASSTVIGKDDSPLAISGDLTVRLKHFDYVKASAMQGDEKMRTLINSSLNALFVVSPASYLTVFANLSIPFDFSGFFVNQQAFSPNYENFGNPGERVLGFHPATDFYGVAINENMLVGMDMRGGDFGATLLMGGVIWTNQSPLSIWERETNPRFISQYELYEEEKVVSVYYKEKGFKPVKEGGRAFWTNRPFGGILLDVHTLPWNLKGQLMLSQPTNIDIGVRDGLRLNSRDGGEQELIGTYDYRGTTISGRLAKEKIEFGEASLTLGANYVGNIFDAAQVYEDGFRSNFFSRIDTSIKYQNLHVATMDLKGNLTPKVFLAFDLALSWDDTISIRPTDVDFASNSSYYNAKDTEAKSSAPTFGVYLKAQDKHWEPITLEFIYLPKNFYSPYSISNPDRWPAWRQDEFYLGAGTYRYGPNMIGANLKLEPEFNRGRFDLQYGIHKQVEKGEDIINFKYNLVGRQLWETSFSWTRHKPFFNLDSAANGRYVARVAGKPFPTPFLKTSDQTGGLRSGYGEVWDAFAPYESALDAFYCSQYYFIKQYSPDDAPCNMPTSVKWNSTISADMGYDIGHWFGTNRNIMLQLYTSLSGVSKSFIPVAYTDKYDNDMLMWSLFMQSEPAVAITSKLHGVLILGMEMFRAEKAYVNLGGYKRGEINLGGIGNNGGKSSYNAFYQNAIFYYQLSPINIQQTALGFGFDWDYAARAGLHFRYKYLTSSDENLPQNDWKAHHVQAETKVWF